MTNTPKPRKSLIRQPRPLSKPWQLLFNGLAIAMFLTYVITSLAFPIGPQYHRGIYATLTLVMIFISFPFSSRSPSNRPSGIDIGLIVLSLITCGYWIVEFEALNFRAGAETQTDFIISVIGIPLGLEATRRVLGFSLPIIGIAAICFGLFGQYLPEPFEHAGFSIEEIAVYLFLSSNGFFGIMTNILATFVILFIFFGAILEAIGASRLFMDFPISILGHRPGGPAKVSVLASALFGSISGSAIANTVSTGTFTIPLMKKSGFPPRVAGAIEPAASIGGMFLPPVMGAGGFIMAELTGIPYSKIMLYSLIPALVYFGSIIMLIHFEAKKQGITATARSPHSPKPMDILKSDGYMVLPLAGVATMLLLGYSPGFSASSGIVLMVLMGLIQPKGRKTPKDLTKAAINGTSNTLIIGATIGVIGIIVGMIELTGIGLQISSMFLSLVDAVKLPTNWLGIDSSWILSADHLIQTLLTVILTAIASLILGMGAPVTAAYLITVVLVGPALTELGVSIIAAHMIVYWLSQDSNITPPVCVAAYAGAAIAKADPWQTGWTAFKYAKMLYLMPILFAFHPEALLGGTLLENIVFWLLIIPVTVLFAAVLQGYLFRPLTRWERLLLTVLMIGMLTRMEEVRWASLGLTVMIMLLQVRSQKQAKT